MRAMIFHCGFVVMLCLIPARVQAQGTREDYPILDWTMVSSRDEESRFYTLYQPAYHSTSTEDRIILSRRSHCSPVPWGWEHDMYFELCFREGSSCFNYFRYRGDVCCEWYTGPQKFCVRKDQIWSHMEGPFEGADGNWSITYVARIQDAVQQPYQRPDGTWRLTELRTYSVIDGSVLFAPTQELRRKLGRVVRHVMLAPLDNVTSRITSEGHSRSMSTRVVRDGWGSYQLVLPVMLSQTWGPDSDTIELRYDSHSGAMRRSSRTTGRLRFGVDSTVLEISSTVRLREAGRFEGVITLSDVRDLRVRTYNDTMGVVSEDSTVVTIRSAEISIDFRDPEVSFEAKARPDRVLMDFETSEAGTAHMQQLRIWNIGHAPLRVLRQDILGSDAGSFSIEQPFRDVIDQGSFSDLTLRMDMGTTAQQQATLHIETNDPAHPTLLIALSAVLSRVEQQEPVRRPGLSLGAVYPHPLVTSVQSVSTIELNVTSSATVSAQLYDASGKCLTDFSWGWIPAGVHTRNIPLPDVPAGAHHLVVRAVDGYGVEIKSTPVFIVR